MSSSPKIVSYNEIIELTDNESFDSQLIKSIGDGFASFSSKKFNLCPIQTMGAPPMAPFPNPSSSSSNTTPSSYAAQVCVKSGYITNDSHFVIKVAAGGYPLPQNTGLMQLYSQKTAKLDALLLDEGVLTELRTAAAGALAVSHLGPTKVTKIGMVGTGIQARYQMRYLRQVTDCRDVLVWGRNADKVESLRKELAGGGWTAAVAAGVDDLLKLCDVIITTTCSRDAVLREVPVRDDESSVLIVCIGADSIGKQELSSDLVATADCLVCDSILQTQERGEFQHAIKEQKVSLENICEIGDIVAGTISIAKNRKLTIFDSSGVAVQDCVVAKMVFNALLK